MMILTFDWLIQHLDSYQCSKAAFAITCRIIVIDEKWVEEAKDDGGVYYAKTIPLFAILNSKYH